MSVPHQRSVDSLGLLVTRLPAGELRVSVTGEVDLLTAPSLIGALRRAVRTAAAHGSCRVVCDLDGVTFFGASGLHALVDGDADARSHEVDLTIVAARGAARRSLSLTALDRTLAVTDGVRVPPSEFSLGSRHDDVVASVDSPRPAD